MIDLGEGMTSFSDTVRACQEAGKHQSIVRVKTAGVVVFAAPGDNPHVLYRSYFPTMHSRENMDCYYGRRVSLG